MKHKILLTLTLALILFAVAALVAAPSAAQQEMQAAEETAPPLFFADAWARPTANEAGEPISDVSAAYMLILNMGDEDIRVVSASSPAAEMVQLHEMVMQGDVMQMRELEDGLLLPAGEITALRPGGLHVMLMGVTEPLVEGTAIPVTLVLEDGTELVIGVPVQNRMMAMQGG